MALLSLGMAALDAAASTEEGKAITDKVARSGRDAMQSLTLWTQKALSTQQSADARQVATRRTAEAQRIVDRAMKNYSDAHSNADAPARVQQKVLQTQTVVDAIISTRADKKLSVGGQLIPGQALRIAEEYYNDYRVFMEVRQFLAQGNTMSRDIGWYRKQAKLQPLLNDDKFALAYAAWRAQNGGV